MIQLHRWRTVLPFGVYLPFSETRKFWRNLRTVRDVVMDIISKKRQQLQQGEGTCLILYNYKFCWSP